MSPQNTNTSAATMRQESVYHQVFRTPVMAVKIYNFWDEHTIQPFWDNHSWHYLKNNYMHVLDQKKKSSWYCSTTL